MKVETVEGFRYSVHGKCRSTVHENKFSWS